MEYDAIIIGSGQAGNPLAERLASQNWKVALVERGRLGGTCVNTGCTPTKTLVQRAQIAHYARNSFKWGIRSEAISVDMKAVMNQKNKVVSEWHESVRKGLADAKSVDVFHGEARFLDSKRVQVGDHRLSSPKIFINTGASPTIPSIPGLEGLPYLTNETIIDLGSVPGSLIVVGGGYIGLEFGQMFSRFGSKVTILQRGAQLLPHEDEDIAEALRSILEDEGIKIILESKIESIKYLEEFSVSVEGGPEINSTHLLIATGRHPNTSFLNLARAGVKTDGQGAILVNDRLETSAEGIWALGDVKGGPAFTHISYNDYQVVTANLLDGADRSIKDRIVPYCVFTDPELGAFGMTEKEARRSGRPIKVGKVPMSNVARAVERDESRGFIKIVVDAKTDQILGARILGVEAGEIIQLLYALAVARQPYTFLAELIFIHPTLMEGFFGLVASVKDN